jgi:hypothetical protein
LLSILGIGIRSKDFINPAKSSGQLNDPVAGIKEEEEGLRVGREGLTRQRGSGHRVPEHDQEFSPADSNTPNFAHETCGKK